MHCRRPPRFGFLLWAALLLAAAEAGAQPEGLKPLNIDRPLTRTVWIDTELNGTTDFPPPKGQTLGTDASARYYSEEMGPGGEPYTMLRGIWSVSFLTPDIGTIFVSDTRATEYFFDVLFQGSIPDYTPQSCDLLIKVNIPTRDVLLVYGNCAFTITGFPFTAGAVHNTLPPPGFFGVPGTEPVGYEEDTSGIFMGSPPSQSFCTDLFSSYAGFTGCGSPPNGAPGEGDLGTYIPPKFTYRLSDGKVHAPGVLVLSGQIPGSTSRSWSWMGDIRIFEEVIPVPAAGPWSLVALGLALLAPAVVAIQRRAR